MSDTDECEPFVEPKAKAAKRNFQSTWLEKYKWLRYNNTKGMLCLICIESSKANPFNSGCITFRTSKLTRHVESQEHQNALKEVHMISNFERAVVNSVALQEKAVVSALRTVYWLGKEYIATEKYRSLLNFLKLQGCKDLENLTVGKNASYDSVQSAKEFQSVIAENIQSGITEKLQKSSFVSVMADESTDIAVSKKLVIYAKLISQSDCIIPETHFLTNITIEEELCTASCVAQKIKNVLAARGVSLHKVMSFGSDGASIMTGRVGGVSTLLKKENPFMINIHCMAHRLALCSSQAASNVATMEKYRQLLTDLYYYFSKSSKRTAGLKAIQEVLQSPKLKVKEMHAVRWFAFYSALETVFRSWDALVTYFANHRNDAKAVGFLKKLTQVQNVATMYYLMDVIPWLTQLNQIFQKEDLDVSIIRTCISTTLKEIGKVKEGNGFYTKKLTETLKQDESGDWYLGEHKISVSEAAKAQAIKSRDAFIDNLTEQITARFPQESQDLVDAFSILSLRGVSFMTSEELSNYGNVQLLKLLNHFGQERSNERGVIFPAVVNPTQAKVEWSLLKDVVKEQHYPTEKLSTLWSCIVKFHADTFPNLLKLAELAVILPLQTADVERGFSAQNLTKTAHRNRMEAETLDNLMTISVEGPSVESYDFNKAVLLWRGKKERRIFKKTS